MRFPPPRVLAAGIAHIALYLVVFPVVTLLLVFAGSVQFGVSFSTLSLAPLVLSILYWVGLFGDAGGNPGTTGTLELGSVATKTIVNDGLAERSNTSRIIRNRGLGVSAYSMYFFGLSLASILVYTGTVP